MLDICESGTCLENGIGGIFFGMTDFEPTCYNKFTIK